MKRLTKIIMMTTTLVLLFSACTTKEIIVKTPKPFAFKKLPKIKPQTIRIKKEDLPIYKRYITLLRKKIKFYEMQIDKYIETYNFVKVKK